MRLEPHIMKKIRDKIPPSFENCCQPWMGGTDENGYAILFLKGRTPLRVHRVLYEEAMGEDIPYGMCLYYLCWVKSCCNVDHMFTGLPGKGRAINRDKMNGTILKEIGREVPQSVPDFTNLVRGFPTDV